MDKDIKEIAEKLEANPFTHDVKPYQLKQLAQYILNPWIPVSERLPEFDETVLCYCRIYGRYSGVYARIDDTEWGHWCNQEHCGILPPVLWMPLPPIPDKE